jgi:DNA polymerase III delta prime subunit
MGGAESVTDEVPNTGTPVDIWYRYPSLKESKLFHEFLARLTSNRDMHVIITAAAETGVGKTTLAFALARLWDMTGWTAEKATMSPKEYEMMYDEVEPGSVLMLDEVQQAADSRRATSSTNVDLSQAFATKRYRQVFGMLTAPSKGWVDGRIGSDSADYWIQAQETPEGRPKGEAKVYRLRNNEHYESNYKEKEEIISWPILDWHPEFQRLEKMKAERMEGKTEAKYVHRDEVEELKNNYWNKCSKKSRYYFVRAMSESGMSQADIRRILDAAEKDSDGEVESLSQPRISDLVNAESFEEVYSS